MIAIPLRDMIVVNENDLFTTLIKIANLVNTQNMRVCVKHSNWMVVMHMNL